MSAPPNTAPPLTAVTLAARYERCLAAIDDDGRPDPACLGFAAWLATRWRPGALPEPRVPPEATSRDRQGRVVLRWYEDEASIQGHVPGARGCYLVPLDAGLPDG